MTSSTNTALWSQLRNGDEKALYALYQLNYDDLLQYGLRLSGNLEDSKDAINLVFAALWANRQQLPEANHPKAYLFTCFKNRVLRIKQQKGQQLLPIHSSTEDCLPATDSVDPH